jgi:hypothetical protein
MRSYRPGEWFGIFGERATVILPPTEKARVAALWELIDGGAGFDETLDVLIASGLRELPGFVLVSEGDGETKVVLRGAARATFTAGGETVELEGSAATTWVERSLHDVTRMEVLVSEGAADIDATDLVIGAGLVRLSRVDQPPAAPDQEAGLEQDSPSAAGFIQPSDDYAGGEDAPADDVSSMVEGTSDEEPAAEPETGEHAVMFAEPETPQEVSLETVSWSLEETAEPEPSWVPSPEVPSPEVPSPEVPATGAPATPLPPDDEDQDQDQDDQDHDGMTRAGGWDPNQFARRQPGIPGQPPAPQVTARPVARLTFSSGETVEVDRAVLVGRAPEARRFTSTDQPRLVTVPSPHQEISSTHLEIRPGSGADHGSAVVTDMGSTNGTVLVQPGLPPEDLQPGIAVQLIPGAIIDLGDGVTIQVTNP